MRERRRFLAAFKCEMVGDCLVEFMLWPRSAVGTS